MGQRHCIKGQRLNKGHTMTLHTYNPQPISLASINFLHLMGSEIQPGQDFIGQGHYKVKGEIKVKDEIKVTT